MQAAIGFINRIIAFALAFAIMAFLILIAVLFGVDCCRASCLSFCSMHWRATGSLGICSAFRYRWYPYNFASGFDVLLWPASLNAGDVRRFKRRASMWQVRSILSLVRYLVLYVWAVSPSV